MMRSAAAVRCRVAAAAAAAAPATRQLRACASAVDSGLDRDPRAYFMANTELVYLRSPRSLMFKAETAAELANELIHQLPLLRDDPKAAIEALDTISCILCLAMDPCEATRSIHPRPEYTDAAERTMDYLDKIAAVANESPHLYEPIVRLCEPEQWAELTTEQRQFVKVMKEEMEAAGAHLSRAKGALASTLFARQAMLQVRAAELRAEHDPTALVSDLLTTRHEIATLMGFDSFATWALRSAVVTDPTEVYFVLLKFAERLRPGANEEYAQLVEERRALATTRDMNTDELVSVKDYELRDLAGLTAAKLYGDPEEEIKPYLSLENVWQGLTMVCEEVFGLKLEKESMTMHEQYHKDVVKYSVKNEQGEMLGTVYADLMTRDGKAYGSGHFTVQLGCEVSPTLLNGLDVMIPEGNRLLPMIIFSCNCEGEYVGDAAVKAWTEVLLTAGETVSVFHEFGHALHTILGQTKYQSLSGTRASQDYVEIFSQLLETYARDPRSLRKWAKHWKTGAPVPKDIVDRLNGVESAFGCLRQLDELVTACVDLVYHGPRPMAFCTLNEEQSGVVVHDLPVGSEQPIDCRRLLGDSLTPLEVTELGVQRAHTMQHLANYPGNYYSYTYARILATVIWNQHLDADPFSRSAGQRIRDTMARGASAPPAALLKELVPDLSADALMAALDSSRSKGKDEVKAADA